MPAPNVNSPAPAEPLPPLLPGELRRLGILSIAVNAALALVKFATGYVGNSYALIADGIESAGDIVTSLIVWTGYRLSTAPPDDNHPFGHGRIETLAGIASAAALLAAAGTIAWNAVHEIITPHHAPAGYTLPVLVLVVAVKEWLSRKVLAAGTREGSLALHGEGWHHRSDALTSAAAATGITVALAGGPGFEAADDWAALAACTVIVYNAHQLGAAAIHELLDGSLPAELHRSIESTAKHTPGVINTEKCRLRKSGTRLLVEIHVRVDPMIPVLEGHRIGHEAKARIKSAHPQVQDVLVHIEPAHQTPPHSDRPA